jgi:hypothetical protein
MSSMFRKLLFISAGAVLLAGLTAGTLSAASSGKSYKVTVDPATLPYHTPTTSGTLNFTYLNNNPGTSTINSLALGFPTSDYTVSSLTLTGGAGSYSPGKNYSAVVATAGSIGCPTTSSPCIQVTNLAPMGYGQSVVLSFTATVATSSLTCADANGTWTPAAWTGSNLSGTSFADSVAYPTTTIGSGTILAANGGSTTVDGVTVTNNSSCNVPVTISRSGNSITVLKPSISGVALTVDVWWYGVAATNPLPPTRVDTPASTQYTDGTHDIKWCGGTPSALVMPTGEVSCLVTENSQIAGSNTVNVKDTIYLLGDWGAAKG